MPNERSFMDVLKYIHPSCCTDLRALRGWIGDGLRMDWGWIVQKNYRTYGPQTGILGIRRRIPFVAVAQWLRLQTPIRKSRVRTPAATFFI